MIYAVGGMVGETGVEQTNGFHIFKSEVASWTPGPHMTAARDSLAVAVCGGKVFASGGQTISGCTNQVDFFDPTSAVWEETISLNKSRSCHCMVALEDTLYVAGGLNGTAIDEVERFQPFNPRSSRRWQVCKSMPTAKIQFGMVTCNGVIYTMGGDSNGEGRILAQVDTFNAKQRPIRWERGIDMLSPRRKFGAVACNDKLLVAGGESRDGILRSISIFDIKHAIWEDGPSMPVARVSTCLAVLGSKVFVMGGRSRLRLKTVDVFDTANGTWTTGPEMLTSLSSFAVAGFVPEKVTFQQEASRLLKNMWSQGQFADATIVCEQDSFSVHRAVLSSASPVFDACFSSNMREGSEAKITITDTSAAAVSAMLRYIYTGALDSALSLQIVPLAHRYQMRTLLDECGQAVLDYLSSDNVAEVVHMLQSLEDEELNLSDVLQEVLARVKADDILFKASMRQVRPRQHYLRS